MAARLQELCRPTGRSEQDCIVEALREHLEDLAAMDLAGQALEDIRADRTRTCTLEEVMTEYGLDD